jgi:phosphocarrier protein
MTNTSLNKQTVKGKFIVLNDRGLHTRPSTELARCASTFKSRVFLKYHKHAVNAKSLLGILMLAAAKGANISIEAEGVDAEEAVQSIIDLAKNNFYIQY